jgi:hypothetical protein
MNNTPTKQQTKQKLNKCGALLLTKRKPEVWKRFFWRVVICSYLAMTPSNVKLRCVRRGKAISITQLISVCV